MYARGAKTSAHRRSLSRFALGAGSKTSASLSRFALGPYTATLVAFLVVNACRSPPVTAPTDGQVDATPLFVPPPADGSTGSDVDIVIVTADACTLIVARTAEEMSTTCASPDEAAIMTRFIVMQRDGGVGAKPCTTFPPTLKPLVTICASETEVLRAIDFLSEQRRIETQRRVPRQR